MADTAAADTASPMMAQYLAIKARYPDALLFYRMGDFYEMFFEDAAAAAEALDIALTKRGQHAGADIPMCGVPVVSAEAYLNTLIRKGFRVAICEQLEDPAEAKKRGSKAVVHRDVVRLVTPGTLTEDGLLDARSACHLAAFAEVRGEGALAWVELSTGALRSAPVARAALSAALARTAPREVLLPETALADPALLALVREADATPTALPQASFDSVSAARRLPGRFGVATLDAFGTFERAELAALGALADYLDLTQKTAPLLRPPVREVAGAVMQIDAATRRNLELTRTLAGSREGSVLAAIDRTVTGPGARALERRIAAPLTDPTAIAARLDAVEAFREAEPLREAVRATLRRTPDAARALARLALDRGSPRDLAAIREALAGAEAIAAALAGTPLEVLAAPLNGLEPLWAQLAALLAEEPPARLIDGGAITPGADPALDEARRLRDEGRGVIAGMQAEYQALTGVAALKIRHNNLLGYYVEVPATHAGKLRQPPLAETFIHRQGLANAARFTTPALSDLEQRILAAADTCLAIERAHVEALRQAVVAQGDAVASCAEALAEIDVAAALAALAEAEGWVRPVVEAGAAFAIEGGRHPVVEQALRRRGEAGFVANDCDLSGEPDSARIRLLTGPNMAGKSTWLRQNALIALLAQAGCPVPAARARIGVVTQLFSRVGAADDLARGRSTFMVEMVETAAILNQAGSGALVILDEIGRGTATYDGLSIAWATLEHLHDVNRCRALFATHYHELTALADRLPALRNATMAVREWQGEVVFLHEVRPGAADRSYGVQVARLAGLPPAVVERARAVLDALEAGDRDKGSRAATLIDDLPLFSAAKVAPPAPKVASEVEDALRTVNPDALSPREALDLVYALKGLVSA